MAEGTQRRLAAVVSADVVGYSRLMVPDESRRLSDLRAHRVDLIDPLIAEHGGRIVKTMGDGLLLEFPSVVQATECVLAVQKDMAERNADVDEDLQIIFRIGVHLGDVVVERDDIFGDGINIAARLESICEPGSVAISGTAYENTAGRVETGFVDGGDQELKNIARPVRVWQWTPDAVPQVSDDAPPTLNLSLPDKPSIAVLPFDNMSSDPEQEYFADGIAEDIITNLSKASGLMVIARNSTFAYKGQATDVRKIGRELGVRYVLEGSTRKSGNRLRLTAQLIDTDTGDHIWAERYDRVIEDIFELQDEITREIVTALRVQLSDGEEAALWSRGAPKLEAWRLVLQGTEAQYSFHAESLLRARKLAQRASEIDSDYASAWILLSATYWYEARIGPVADHESNLARSEVCSKKATELDAGHPMALGSHARNLVLRGRYDEAVETCRRGLTANPGSADGRFFLAYAHHVSGDHGEAIRLFEESKRLDPLHPIYVFPMIARALDAHGNSKAAMKLVREGLTRQPEIFPCLLQLASLLGRQGEVEAAQEAVANARLQSPDFRLSQVDQWLATRDETFKTAFERGLRLAGLPE